MCDDWNTHTDRTDFIQQVEKKYNTLRVLPLSIIGETINSLVTLNVKILKLFLVYIGYSKGIQQTQPVLCVFINAR